MIRKPFKIVTAVIFSGVGAVAHALPASFDAGSVLVEYDRDTFTLAVDGYGVDPGMMSVTPVLNGVILGFNGYLSVSGSSYTYSSSETKTGDYSALFSFTPEVGKSITGYYITYTGTYDIETPGSAEVSGPGTGFSSYGGGYGSPFSVTSFIAGASAPSLTGYVSATGDISYVEVFDRYEDVFVGYESVLDYCDPEELGGNCYYRDEPRYEQVAVYRNETDLGLANINLESITLTASVVPVPSAFILMGSALAGLCGRRLLRRA